MWSNPRIKYGSKCCFFVPVLNRLFGSLPCIDLKDKLAIFAQTLAKRFRMFFFAEKLIPCCFYGCSHLAKNRNRSLVMINAKPFLTMTSPQQLPPLLTKMRTWPVSARQEGKRIVGRHFFDRSALLGWGYMRRGCFAYHAYLTFPCWGKLG